MGAESSRYVSLRDAFFVAVGVAIPLIWMSLSRSGDAAETSAMSDRFSEQRPSSDRPGAGAVEPDLPTPRTTSDARRPLGSTGEETAGEPAGGTPHEVEGIPPDSYFESKYSSFQGVEFVGAAKAMQLLYHSRADVLLEQKLERGEYTTEYLEKGSEFGPSTHRGMWPGDSGPTEMVKAVPLGDGVTELQRVHIFPSEDPELMRWDAERDWLWEKAQPFLDD